MQKYFLKDHLKYIYYNYKMLIYNFSNKNLLISSKFVVKMPQTKN